MSNVKFKHLSIFKKHNEDRSFLLKSCDGVYEVFARWSRFHNAYDCKTTEYIWDNNAQDYKHDAGLLTDVDLADYLIEEVYE